MHLACTARHVFGCECRVYVLPHKCSSSKAVVRFTYVLVSYRCHFSIFISIARLLFCILQPILQQCFPVGIRAKHLPQDAHVLMMTLQLQWRVICGLKHSGL